MERIAIITGGNRGLGKAIIDLLLVDNTTLVISLSRSLHLDHKHLNSNLVFVQTDLSDPFNNEVFNVIREKLTEKTVLYFFNNASVILPISRIGSFSISEIERSLNINVHYPVKFINMLLSRFDTNNLNIVNISSGVATKPLAYWSLYSASKAFMHNFLLTLAQESDSERDLRIFNIDPGVLDTGMQELIREGEFPNKNYFITLKNEDKLIKPKEAALNIFTMIKYGL